MNTILVKAFPAGAFEEISIEMKDWSQKFETLIKERKRIHLTVYQMPNLPPEIKELLNQEYSQFILKSNQDERLLIPNSN